MNLLNETEEHFLSLWYSLSYHHPRHSDWSWGKPSFTIRWVAGSLFLE